MPTYEYRCGSCGHELEAYQPITAKPLKKCPACGKAQLARLISGGGAVLFKGSGFYETDYRSESYKKAAKDEKPADTKADNKADKKTETKAGRNTESKPAKPAADGKAAKKDKAPAA